MKERLLKAYGADGIDLIKNRHRGMTTGIAFETIGRAMVRPGIPVPIRDHHVSNNADKHLARLIRTIANKHGLLGLTVDNIKLTLTYHVDSTPT
jgi:hypothetical protein